MKKPFKRILCICIVILICITSAPINNVSAANAVQIPDDAVKLNDNYYKVYTDAKTWMNAKSYCESRGGHLVTITSIDENDFILSICEKTAKALWIGLTDKDNEGNWSTWITGEQVVYNNWGTDQPDNDTNYGEQDMACIVTYETDWGNKCYPGQWDDSNGNDMLSFICEWDPNEYTISGKITGGSNTSRLAIDGVWYDYDATVDGLTEIIELFAIGEEITCKIRFGKIVACSKTEIKNKVTLSANTTNNIIKYNYKTNKYSPECIQLDINITNNIYSTSRKVIDTQYIAGYDITIDKLVINAQNGDMFYFEDGWFGLEKTQILEKVFDSPVTLKVGETLNFSEDLTAYINDKYIWGETELEKEVKIYAYAYSGDSYIAFDELTVTFNNENAQNVIKNNAETEAQSQVAADILNQTACIIQNKFLSEIFTPEQLKSIQNAIQCKIALCALPESTYKKAGINDKIIEKLMSKAGVSKDWLGTAYTADIKLEVNVDTEKYGQLKVEFKIPFEYFSFGSDNPYGGISFDFSYEVVGGKGKKDVPSEYLSGDILGLGTYANMKNFSDSVQKVALAQLESAYNLGYGDNLNKVGDMLFGGTVTKILSKTAAKSYSHLTFSIMVFPSKQISIKCPVDVFVYDAEGNHCASVEQNEITMSCEDIDIEVVGDEKYLTIYEGDYSVDIIATANGRMNITIDEYSTSNERIRKTSFDNLSLVPGDLFETQIDETYVENEYTLTKNKEETIFSNSDECYIHCIEPIEIIDKEATCIEYGTKHIECEICKETTLNESIPALGHTESDAVIENSSEAKCGQAGSYDSVVYCSVCNEEISHETIIVDALSHQYNKVITAPDCTKEGYTTYTCSLCDDNYVDDEVSALGHDIVVDEAITATCTQTGLTEGQHCSRCDDATVEQEAVPITAHNHVAKYDSTKHWKECACGSKIEIQNHSFVNGNICSCGYKRVVSSTISIRNNTGSRTINYGETLKLTAIVTDKPADAIIIWYVDGVKKGEGETFNVSFESGTETVEVKLVDSNGNVLKNSSGNEISDSETISVKSGFLQKIISFFKNLFGINRTVVQAFKGII